MTRNIDFPEKEPSFLTFSQLMKQLNITDLYHTVSIFSHPITIFKIDRINKHALIIFADGAFRLDVGVLLPFKTVFLKMRQK